MTRREKQRELFIELINYQLKDHGVTYNEVVNSPTWYMDYSTTPEKEKEFIEYCVGRIREVLKVSKVQAEKETSWFILQWGLTTNPNLSTLNKKSTKRQSKIKGSEK